MVGVPASTPAAVSVRPAGSVPLVTPKLYGEAPPLPAIVSLNATPTVPPGSVAGESVIVGHDAGGVLQPPTDVLAASVTEAAVASARPVRLAPAAMVTPACATMFPAKVVPSIVAALVTCQ